MLGACIVSFLEVLQLQDTRLITYTVNSLSCFEIWMHCNEQCKHTQNFPLCYFGAEVWCLLKFFLSSIRQCHSTLVISPEVKHPLLRMGNSKVQKYNGTNASGFPFKLFVLISQKLK